MKGNSIFSIVNPTNGSTVGAGSLKRLITSMRKMGEGSIYYNGAYAGNFQLMSNGLVSYTITMDGTHVEGLL